MFGRFATSDTIRNIYVSIEVLQYLWLAFESPHAFASHNVYTAGIIYFNLLFCVRGKNVQAGKQFACVRTKDVQYICGVKIQFIADAIAD